VVAFGIPAEAKEIHRGCTMSSSAASHPAPPPPRAFGADDRPACPACGKPMAVTRRTPHPTPALRNLYELQTLSCSACDNEISRAIGAGGELLN
jgi:hypothetical protein